MTESEKKKKSMVKTPEHIIDLVYQLLVIRKEDVVIEPCAGQAGFLRRCMEEGVKGWGIEIDPQLCARLRSEGIQIEENDFLKMDETFIKKNWRPTIGFINPPYGIGTSKNPTFYELNFLLHLLDAMEDGGRVAAIIPASSMTGKTKEVKEMKKQLLKKHTLEAVITLNSNSFYPADVSGVVAFFTVGHAHPHDKNVKLINFQRDGYQVVTHKGLIDTGEAKERRKELFEIWKGKRSDDLCISTMLDASDEWLHASFYFSKSIPTDEVFLKEVKRYISFKIGVILNGKGNLFSDHLSSIQCEEVESLDSKKWKKCQIEDVFQVAGTKVTPAGEYRNEGSVPRLCSSREQNGVEGWYDNVATEKGNVITVDSAATGCAHYQPFDFSASGHIEKLSIKDNNLNLFCGLFICGVINFYFAGKFDYGYKCNKRRLRKQWIMLPINQSGCVDYEYMAAYIKNIFMRSLSDIKKYF